MTDLKAMAIRKARYHLSKDPDGFLLWKPAISQNIIEELAPIDVFKNQIPTIR